MFSALIYVALFVALCADYYLYKTRISKYKVLWIIQSLFFCLPVASESIIIFFIDNRSTLWQLITLWSLSIFIFSFICKIFIASAILLKDKRGKSYFPVAYSLTLIFASIYLYGTFVSRCRVTVNKLEIFSEDLPSSFDGYKVALFSDVHLGTMYFDNHLLERVVDSINSLQADIVVQCGDLINIHISEFDQSRINTLKRIKAPVYAVMGNHDLGYYLRDTLNESPKVSLDSLITIQSSVLNWRVLKNENVVIKNNNDSIFIAGVTFPDNLRLHNFNSTYGGSDIRKAMSSIKRSDFSILLSHTPELMDSLPEKSDVVDVMLSGHVHGMQLKIGNCSPSYLFYRVNTGYNKINDVSLYVNDGIGVVGHPFRFGAPPEITLITLKRGSGQ